MKIRPNALYPFLPRSTFINTEGPLEIVRPLAGVTLKEKETANFEIEVSRLLNDPKWLVNGKAFLSDDRRRISSRGHVHLLTIHDLEVEDAGIYAFEVSLLFSVLELVGLFFFAVTDFFFNLKDVSLFSLYDSSFVSSLS